jgi:hypothetical protein
MDLRIAGLAPMGTDFYLRHGTGASAPADMVWNSLRGGFDGDGAADVSGYCIDAPERMPAGAARRGVAGRALVATWLRAR